MTESRLSAVTAAAKALGHPARARVMAMLSGGPLCVCQMAAVLAAASSTVSEHLRELKRAGLLIEEKSGKFVLYRLSPSDDAARWARVVLAGLAGDQVAAADAELVKRVRRVSVQEFAASGRRLPAVPASRASGRQSKRSRRNAKA